MVFHNLLTEVGKGEVVDIFTVIDSSVKDSADIGKMLLVHPDGRKEGHMDERLFGQIQALRHDKKWKKPVAVWFETQEGDKHRVFWDRIFNKFQAIVLGGGHISQPLVQILSLLDFDVTVIDDRPDFANQARFPGAAKVICESFQPALKKLTIGNDTALIIVTRGHRYDLDCLRAIIGEKARYLGMIGSKRRVLEIINLLKEEGAPDGFAEQLRAPIGLDIEAETPAEIAVSIAAEVVSVFRGGTSQPLSKCEEVI